MMAEICAEIRRELFACQDVKFKELNLKLIPSLDASRVIGVRTPDVRRIAKQYGKRQNVDSFLAALPHDYFEENNVHAAIIASFRDYEMTVAALDKFLPFVDNWATCDMMTPTVFKKNTERLIVEIRRWLCSGKTYSVRFAIRMLMCFYLEDNYLPEYAELVSGVKSDEYYVKMMAAWYFATALAKRYDDILPFIADGQLDKWTHNKAVQKAVESFRITPEQKAHLKTLKIK